MVDVVKTPVVLQAWIVKKNLDIAALNHGCRSFFKTLISFSHFFFYNKCFLNLDIAPILVILRDLQYILLREGLDI